MARSSNGKPLPAHEAKRAATFSMKATFERLAETAGDRLKMTLYQPLGTVRHQGPLLMIFGPCFAPVDSLCGPRDLIFRSPSSRTTIPLRSDDLDAI
jgi:hypothetical protein